MRFSIFTPTHRADHLIEAYESLLLQAFADWEWVILANGTALIPREINDPRVRVERAPDDIKGVGALKRYACGLCRGEFLVELDHDDLLTDDALAKIDAAIAATDADFLYSDAANFRADGTCEVYGGAWGWHAYTRTYRGREYEVNASFVPDASSLSQIFYAPNHVRVWRASTYAAAGGHDPAFAICDDQDLICRTYLSGAKFHHIPECLYLYRLHDAQTYMQRNAEIQEKQQQVANEYVYKLIAEWSRREGLPMLDLGGAENKVAGYLSVDLRDADIVCDITQGLPFADSSVGCVRAVDFLEHVPHCRDSRCDHKGCAVGLMNEIYRVLAPGGWLISATPSTDGRGAWQDPTHCSGWNPNSFWYYTRRQQQRFVPGITARFQGARIWQEFPSDWHKQHNIPYVYADLVALKGQRQCGICEI